jgi:beta-glucosidase-like glycosyl hydrolase
MDKKSILMVNFKPMLQMKRLLIIIVMFITFFQLRPISRADDDTFNGYINRMTLKEKIGQVIFLGFQGRTFNEKDFAHIKKIKPGGIVLYARNFKDASDIPPLISRIRSIFGNQELPLFFAIDQEGGIVHRIRGESYSPPSAPAIGATNSYSIAKEIGLSVGDELRSLGININLSPVLDVPIDISPSPMIGRSYSNDYRTVEKLGVAYISGLKDAGLLSTAKHFPGIGRAHEDSHRSLPHIIWKTQDEKNNDIMPFKGAVKAGVDIMMVGHFIAEPGDDKNPISLSSYWMKDVLRKNLGFDGLIIVDNIEMKPIADIMSVPEAAVQSFKAGADIIMISHEKKNQEAVFNALLEAVKKGDISIERLNESVGRIIEAKRKIASRKTDMDISYNLKDISRLVAEKSVTALRLNNSPSYTINKDKNVLFIGYDLTLFKAVRDTFRNTEILNTTLINYKKMNPEIPIVKFIKKFDALIIDADYSDISDIISICNDLNMKYVIVLSHPWNIQRTLEKFKPNWIVITFESSREYLNVAMDIITGLKKAEGNLPYDIDLPPNYIYSRS